MPTPAELYPFSTQDGKVIDLDIIKPLGMISVTLTTTFANVVLPVKYNLSAIFSSADAYLDTTGTASSTPTSGADNVGWLFIPANTVVIAQLPTVTAKIRGVTVVGAMHITAIQQWAALALPRQFNSKVS